MLPAKRKPVKSGIERAPKREWPRHRAFVRRHQCCIAGKAGHWCIGPIVFAHVRSSQAAGTGQKPPDWFGISLCDGAHNQQHIMGETGFETLWGIDMKKLAMEFARNSPDLAMRETMRQLGLLP